MYEDQAGSEDKDSCSTEPDQLTAANSLQMVMGVGGDAAGYGSGGGGSKRPKRRRRILDAIGPTAAAAQTDRYSSAGGDFYESQILGGVGGDPAEPPVADYYDVFGQYVANELRQMDRQSVIIAKRLVNEVLFLGQMGMLNVNTRIETPPSSSSSSGRRKNAAAKSSDHHHQQNNHHGAQQPDGRDSLTPVEFMETS